MAQGLPSRIVLDFLIARDRSYWILTVAGVCRLPAEAKVGTQCRLLATPASPGKYDTDSMVETADGSVWVATDLALYRASADRQRLDRILSASAPEIFEADRKSVVEGKSV